MGDSKWNIRFKVFWHGLSKKSSIVSLEPINENTSTKFAQWRKHFARINNSTTFCSFTWDYIFSFFWNLKLQGIPMTMRSEWGRFLSRLLASIDELKTPEMDHDDYPYSNPRNDVWDDHLNIHKGVMQMWKRISLPFQNQLVGPLINFDCLVVVERVEK